MWSSPLTTWTAFSGSSTATYVHPEDELGRATYCSWSISAW